MNPRALVLGTSLALAACGDKDPAGADDSGPDLTWRPCRTWCEDLADTYGALSTSASGPQDTSLPGWSTGSFDPDAYAATCVAAPEDGQCESCTGFYFTNYLQPIGVAGSCDFVYRPGPAQAAALDEATLAARASECEASCDDYGLAH
jgi:hypothetical protein